MDKNVFFHLASRIMSYSRDVQDSETADYLYKEECSDGAIAALKVLGDFYSEYGEFPADREEGELLAERFRSEAEFEGEGFKNICEMAAKRIENMNLPETINLRHVYTIHYDKINKDGESPRGLCDVFKGNSYELKCHLKQMSDNGCINFSVSIDEIKKGKSIEK